MLKPLTRQFSSAARLACMLLALWGGAALQARTAAAPAQQVSGFVVRGEREQAAAPQAHRPLPFVARPASPASETAAPLAVTEARKLYLLHCTLLC